MEDREIVSLYFARSEQAIAESDRKYGRYCGAIAQRIVAFREDAEECVQDTWLRAWDVIPPERPARLGVFLGRITRNLALDRVRFLSRDKRGGSGAQPAYEELEAVLSGDDAEKLVDALALRQALGRFLAGLPKRQRVIFLRRYWYFQPVKEIAARYDFTQGKVKSMLLRTRRKLGKFLKEEGLC